ncbi:hypothetical protein N9Y17_01655, partial [Gammaproteobacteria bacterium]|nr:hypothetical protein [Gammaproteobacteria bacterium]
MGVLVMNEFHGRIYQAILSDQKFNSVDAFKHFLSDGQKSELSALAASIDQQEKMERVCLIINSEAPGLTKLEKLSSLHTKGERIDFKDFKSISEVQQSVSQKLETKDEKKDKTDSSKIGKDEDGNFQVKPKKNGRIVDNRYNGQKLFNRAYEKKDAKTPIDLNKKMTYTTGYTSFLGNKFRHHKTTEGFLENAVKAGVPCPICTQENLNKESKTMIEFITKRYKKSKIMIDFMKKRDGVISRMSPSDTLIVSSSDSNSVPSSSLAVSNNSASNNSAPLNDVQNNDKISIDRNLMTLEQWSDVNNKAYKKLKGEYKGKEEDITFLRSYINKPSEASSKHGKKPENSDASKSISQTTASDQATSNETTTQGNVDASQQATGPHRFFEVIRDFGEFLNSQLFSTGVNGKSNAPGS